MRHPAGRTETRERAALDYAARGWSVVPVEPGGKRPLVRWEELQARRAPPEEVRAWFARWPDANVGVVTGALSGLLVLDVDPRHGGEESLAALEAERGALPPTLEAATGGGGRHLYFAHPGGVVRNRVGLRPGIDLRGDGGLVVAPPSRHASGRAYRWREGRGPEEIAPAALPAGLLEPPGSAHGGGHPLAWWRERVREIVREGERNGRIASLTGHLLHRGVDPEVATELLLSWNRVHCRPPLSDEEVARTVESITRTHRRHEPEASGE
jgi:hypothetical protein